MSNLSNSIDRLIASKTEPIINTLTAMENKVDANLKRMKKTMLDLCNVSSIEVDEEIGECEVYWRTERDPVETKIIVECVKVEGKEVTLSESNMQSLIEELFFGISKIVRV